MGYLPRESGFEALTRWLGRRWVALALVILTLLAATARFYELAEFRVFTAMRLMKGLMLAALMAVACSYQ